MSELLSAHEVAARAAHETSFCTFLDRHLDQEMLRFTTAGSVDDGKSTLIGRLLHDTKSVYEDQLASIRASRVGRAGAGVVDLSLLTDGLKAEREQGITIDVAYRYFSTAKRKFIIADTPGHEQYTRNMATGASTADVAIVLIDANAFAKAGKLLPQSRRHTYIASLLRIPHVVAAVNKMDLVGYSEELFLRIQAEFHALTAKLGLANTAAIPMSALAGDNVVETSSAMPWYFGPTLLDYLETVPLQITTPRNEPMRFPVQLVQRPDAEFRGFAGRVERGEVSPGLRVKALPSGRTTRVKTIVTYDGDLKSARYPQSVTLELEDEIDLSRGEMLVAEGSPEPQSSTRFRAMVVWMHEETLAVGKSYLAKHTTRTVRATVRAIRYSVNVNTAEHQPAAELTMNEIAEVEFETSLPLFFDAYAESRSMGSLILIDAISNATVGAAMIVAGVEREGLAGVAVQGETSNPRDVAARLRDRVDTVTPVLAAISHEAAVSVPVPGKWSLQETLGHLCDSAMNNQQRIVRMQLQASLEFPGYEQDDWVRTQHYSQLPWSEVCGLWQSLNRHLAHTMEHVNPSALSNVWYFEGEALTLAFIMEDYLTHLDHHLRAFMPNLDGSSAQ